VQAVISVKVSHIRFFPCPKTVASVLGAMDRPSMTKADAYEEVSLLSGHDDTSRCSQYRSDVSTKIATIAPSTAV
jgi:hypothetical protein